MPRGGAKSANSAIRAGEFFVPVFELGKEGQSIHDVWVEDGIAYSSNWRDGVYLVDVGNGIAGSKSIAILKTTANVTGFNIYSTGTMGSIKTKHYGLRID